MPTSMPAPATSFAYPFTVLRVFEQLGDPDGQIAAPWAKFVGNQSTLLTFEIDGVPTFPSPIPSKSQSEAYLLVQLFGVSSYGNTFLLNGRKLDGFGLPPAPLGWQTWMDVVTEPLLKQGTNTIQFVRELSSAGNFVIGSLVVAWKETPPTS